MSNIKGLLTIAMLLSLGIFALVRANPEITYDDDEDPWIPVPRDFKDHGIPCSHIMKNDAPSCRDCCTTSGFLDYKINSKGCGCQRELSYRQCGDFRGDEKGCESCCSSFKFSVNRLVGPYKKCGCAEPRGYV